MHSCIEQWKTKNRKKNTKTNLCPKVQKLKQPEPNEYKLSTKHSQDNDV